jgi:hypothetical protein
MLLFPVEYNIHVDRERQVNWVKEFPVHEIKKIPFIPILCKISIKGYQTTNSIHKM